MFDPNNPIVQLDVRGEPYWIPNDGRELRQARIVVWEDLDFERAHCLEIPFIEGLARHPETDDAVHAIVYETVMAQPGVTALHPAYRGQWVVDADETFSESALVRDLYLALDGWWERSPRHPDYFARNGLQRPSG